jgi:hypothetical protein
MPQIQFERIWTAQCAAAQNVKQRFGLANALDCLIVEKLLNFAEAAERYREFAQELPEFLRAIRDVFTVQETGEYALWLERTKRLSRLQSRTLRVISSVSEYIH